MSGIAGLGRLWNSIQTWLFPMLEDELGELDQKHPGICLRLRDLRTAVAHGQLYCSRLKFALMHV
jgi:hypothetical protein